MRTPGHAKTRWMAPPRCTTRGAAPTAGPSGCWSGCSCPSKACSSARRPRRRPVRRRRGSPATASLHWGTAAEEAAAVGRWRRRLLAGRRGWRRRWRRGRVGRGRPARRAARAGAGVGRLHTLGADLHVDQLSSARSAGPLCGVGRTLCLRRRRRRRRMVLTGDGVTAARTCTARGFLATQWQLLDEPATDEDSLARQAIIFRCAQVAATVCESAGVNHPQPPHAKAGTRQTEAGPILPPPHPALAGCFSLERARAPKQTAGARARCPDNAGVTLWWLSS